MSTRDPKTAKIGVEILPLEVGYLPEYFEKKGETELNYTPTARCNSLTKLKEIIASDKTLETLDCTDEALIMFLNSKKYDIDRTVQQLGKYVKFKKSHPEMFSNVCFENMSSLMLSKHFTILPWRCQDGCAIALINPANYDPEIHNITDIQRMYSVLLIQSLRDPMTQVNGFKIIFDGNAGLHVLRLYTPRNMYHCYELIERVLVGRVKEYHIVNMGLPGRILLPIARKFMSAKMQKRLMVHQSVDKLLDYFPKAVLPVEFGGDLQEYDPTEWVRKITSQEELAALNILSN